MSSLAFSQIETSLNGLSIQSRTMIRLLMIQYFTVTEDEIEYMAADQPDSRFMSGEQPKVVQGNREAVLNVSNRVGQYQLFLRQKRELPGLQIDCLQQLMAHTDKEIKVVEFLMSSELNIDKSTQEEAKTQALTTLVKPVQRQLLRAIEQEEISEEEYQAKRLLLEYQLLLRMQERQRRRLKVVKQEYQIAGSAPLQDHEIAHIWGLPLGSLAARKVKALHQYLTTIQEQLQESNAPSAPSQTQTSDPRPDYWNQTFQTLLTRPYERSVVSYSGQERTEELLMQKLQDFANRRMTDDEETKFWGSITKLHDSEHGGMWTSHERAIFSLQRLSAILKEIDPSEESIEEDLRTRIAPPIDQEQLPEPELPDEDPELNEEALGVIQKLVGELDDKRRT
ncbi:MAG: hypothetical protein ACPGYT_06355 [Nitrospirales bacterium]